MGHQEIIIVIISLLAIYLLIKAVVLIFTFFKECNLYRSSTYKAVKNISYYRLNRDKGCFGEYLIYKNLRHYEDDGAKFLFNIYIPKENGDTSEIDVLMISSYGIFVFESKNLAGWIFGDVKNRYWYQILPGKKKSNKEHFYNPIMQNKAHIKALKNFLDVNISIKSIVVFSDDCEIKALDGSYEKAEIVYQYELYDTVKQICNDFSGKELNSEEISEIYTRLFKYTNVSAEIKEKHVKRIDEIS